MNIPKLSLKPSPQSQKIFQRRLLRFPKKIIGGVIALLVAGIFFLLLVSFNVKDVSVSSATDFVCTNIDGILNTANLKGKSLFLVNSEAVESHLKSKFICLDAIKIKTKLPDQISLEVKEKLPAILVNSIQVNTTVLSELSKNSEATVSSETARIASEAENNIFFNKQESSGSGFVSDKDGLIYADEKQYQNKGRGDLMSLLTLYVINEEVAVGKNLGRNRVPYLMEILEELKKEGIYPGRMNLLGENLFLDTGDKRINFSLEKPPDKQVISLQLILQKAKIESKQVVKIDLRFDKPVVVYSSLKKE